MTGWENTVGMETTASRQSALCFLLHKEMQTDLENIHWPPDPQTHESGEHYKKLETTDECRPSAIPALKSKTKAKKASRDAANAELGPVQTKKTHR